MTNPINDNLMRIVRSGSHSHASTASDDPKRRPAILPINLFVTARKALIDRRRHRRTYDEFMALDDRALADIGMHRSQIRAIVDAMYQRAELRAVTEPVLGTRSGGWSWLSAILRRLGALRASSSPIA